MTPQIIENTPVNQSFWTDVELNFVQTYMEETNANYELTIPMPVLRSYVQIVQKLNSPGNCTFVDGEKSPAFNLLKRHIMRHLNVEDADLTTFVGILNTFNFSSVLKIMLTENMKTFMHNFFIANC